MFDVGIYCIAPFLMMAGNDPVRVAANAVRNGAQIAAWGGRIADGAAGFAGGVLGGMASLSGPVPVTWVQLRNWTRNEQRGVNQPFNMTVLTAALASAADRGADVFCLHPLQTCPSVEAGIARIPGAGFAAATSAAAVCGVTAATCGCAAAGAFSSFANSAPAGLLPEIFDNAIQPTTATAATDAAADRA